MTTCMGCWWWSKGSCVQYWKELETRNITLAVKVYCILCVYNFFLHLYIFHIKTFLSFVEREAVEKRWQMVKVSSGTDHRVRPLDSVAQWKAHEWKTWFLLWIPILKGNIDFNVNTLLSKFTLGILLLLQDQITHEVQFYTVARALLPQIYKI